MTLRSAPYYALMSIESKAEYARDQRGEIVAPLTPPQRAALATELRATVDLGTTRAHMYQTLADRAQAALEALDAPSPRERASVAWEQSLILIGDQDLDVDAAIAALGGEVDPDVDIVF